MRILNFQGKQTNLYGHGKNFRTIVAEINLRDRIKKKGSLLIN